MVDFDPEKELADTDALVLLPAAACAAKGGLMGEGEEGDVAVSLPPAPAAAVGDDDDALVAAVVEKEGKDEEAAGEGGGGADAAATTAAAIAAAAAEAAVVTITVMQGKTAHAIAFDAGTYSPAPTRLLAFVRFGQSQSLTDAPITH